MTVRAECTVNLTSTMLSTTIGVKPAAIIALKHDFWSILGHTTARAPGFEVLNAEKVRANDILLHAR